MLVPLHLLLWRWKFWWISDNSSWRVKLPILVVIISIVTCATDHLRCCCFGARLVQFFLAAEAFTTRPQWLQQHINTHACGSCYSWHCDAPIPCNSRTFSQTCQRWPPSGPDGCGQPRQVADLQLLLALTHVKVLVCLSRVLFFLDLPFFLTGYVYRRNCQTASTIGLRL